MQYGLCYQLTSLDVFVKYNMPGGRLRDLVKRHLTNRKSQ